MNNDIEALKAVLRQLGWSDELITSIEAASAISDSPAFDEAHGEYMNRWRVIDSSGFDLALPPSSSVSNFELKPA